MRLIYLSLPNIERELPSLPPPVAHLPLEQTTAHSGRLAPQDLLYGLSFTKVDSSTGPNYDAP